MNTKDPYGVPMGVVPRLAKRGMSNLRQAAQAALEALESLQGGCTDHDDGTVEAITVWCPEVVEALRAALAEPQPEPPFADIGKLVLWTMDQATANGANAVSMPDEIVSVAAWLSGVAPQAQQPQPEPVAVSGNSARQVFANHELPQPEPVAWAGDPSTQDYTSTQPEPVAWRRVLHTSDGTKYWGYTDTKVFDWDEPVYAAPQAQQHDCERRPYGDLRNAKWLDPECYAKGACQSLIFKQAQQPRPEPVAWWLYGTGDVYIAAEFTPDYEHLGDWVPLVRGAAPQAQQPLTDDPTNKHAIKVPGYGWVDTKAVRAIEAAHGIK